ncbi:MAG: SDR family oxidoreductase [Pseudomonadota bacterium]|nr:MAG: SDR family oxidoreductase [Pseudomonadota bacterium]
MLRRLDKRTALVTGAGRGIGAAIAARLAEEGARIVVADRDGEAAAALATEIRNKGAEALAVTVDVADSGEVRQMMNRIQERFGGLDVLVNNAGIIRDGWLGKLSDEDFDQVIAVNLKGAFLCCRAALGLLKQSQSARIVNIASRSWLGNPGQANYAASKGGVVSLTRTLALELARFSINVNAVAPGLIDTPMVRSMPEQAREKLIARQPTGQMGRVEDIAAAVAFLAGPDADFISGQVLHVDGGKSCGILGL